MYSLLIRNEVVGVVWEGEDAKRKKRGGKTKESPSPPPPTLFSTCKQKKATRASASLSLLQYRKEKIIF